MAVPCCETKVTPENLQRTEAPTELTRISDEFNPNLFLWLQTAQRLKLSDTVNVNNARCGFTHKYLLLFFRSFFFFFLSNPLWLSSTRRFSVRTQSTHQVNVRETGFVKLLCLLSAAQWAAPSLLSRLCFCSIDVHGNTHTHWPIFFSCTPSSCLISDARAYLMMWIETTVPWCYGFCSMWRTEMMIINVIVAETLFDLNHGSHFHRVS